MKNIIICVSIFLNILGIFFSIKVCSHSNVLEQKVELCEDEIFKILFREQMGYVNVEGVEQCFGKMIIVLPEGMCMGCSEGLFRQIEDLSEIQKNNLVLVVPKTIQKEFDIYNNSIYHIKNIIYSSDFLNFTSSESILFYMTKDGKISVPISLNYYSKRIDRFYRTIFNDLD